MQFPRGHRDVTANSLRAEARRRVPGPVPLLSRKHRDLQTCKPCPAPHHVSGWKAVVFRKYVIYFNL